MKYRIHYHGQIVRGNYNAVKYSDGFVQRESMRAQTFDNLADVPEIYRSEFAEMLDRGQATRNNGIEVFCILDTDRKGKV